MEKTIPFSNFELNPTLSNAITQMGFECATPIQELTIEPILDGKDIFAQAETGSGKTAAFSIPIIEKIYRDGLIEREDNQDVLYVVLSPTRELAQQTHNVITQQGKDLGVNSICLIGGESIEKQKQLLQKKPHILVATPGRICDLLKRKETSITNCHGIVFDEADRLFDMGFKNDIEYILRLTPKERQLIMVSATINNDVLNTAYKFHSHPIELKVSEDSLLVENIDHKIAMLSSKEKMPLLVNLIQKHENAYALVFCNTQFQTHLVAEWLIKMGFKAKPISGRLPQNKRTALMKEFRTREITILVCTDVAARGLDIKDVNLVINYDMPQDAVNYVHRIGRTGRAGKSGEAISFCAHEDCESLDEIYTLIDCKIPKMELENDDFSINICKKPFIDHKTLRVIDNKVTNNNNRRVKASTAINRYQPSTTTQHNQEINIVKRPEQSRKQVFTIQTSTTTKATQAALDFFKIKYDSQLHLESSEKGRKRFIIFGPRLTKYQYSARPTYKKIVLPFLIQIIQLSNLKLYAKMSFDGKTIKAFFSGNDEKMLTRNDNELLKAFEDLTRIHLYKTTTVPRDIRISFRCRGYKGQEQSLLKMIDRMAKKVIETQEPITIKPLHSADRRLVHQHLDKDSQLKTESIGEGALKRIQISLI